MSVTKSDTLPLRTEQDIVLARQAVRKLTQELGFGIVDQDTHAHPAGRRLGKLMRDEAPGLIAMENVVLEVE